MFRRRRRGEVSAKEVARLARHNPKVTALDVRVVRELEERPLPSARRGLLGWLRRSS